LRELYKELDIVADIKKKGLEWIGHVVRLVQGRTVKKIFESNPEGSRKGRPIQLRSKDSYVKTQLVI
jgi:hypothetical protein